MWMKIFRVFLLALLCGAGAYSEHRGDIPRATLSAAIATLVLVSGNRGNWQ